MYKKEEGYVFEKMVLLENFCKCKIWLFMEYLEMLFVVYVIVIVFVVIIVFLIILFCVEIVFWLLSYDCVNGKLNFVDFYFILEILCIVWFIYEVFICFFLCLSKIKYFKDF